MHVGLGFVTIITFVTIIALGLTIITKLSIRKYEKRFKSVNEFLVYA